MPYETDWKPVNDEDTDFKCSECGSGDVWYRLWESSDGGHDDVECVCHSCRRTWWIEGADA